MALGARQAKELMYVNSENIKKSEYKFLIFLIVSIVILVCLISSFFVPYFESFWNKHIFFSLGSYFVLIPVVHSRFFEIKKNAIGSENKLINNDDLSSSLKIIEKIISYMWILGSVLLLLKEWIKI